MLIPTILFFIRSSGLDQDDSWNPDHYKYISAISNGIRQMPFGMVSGVAGLADIKSSAGDLISRSTLVKFFHVYQLMDLYNQFVILKDNTNLIWTLHNNLRGGELAAQFENSMSRIKTICEDIEPLVDELKNHFELGDKHSFKQVALYISWKFERIAGELNKALQNVVALIEKIDDKARTSYTNLAIRGVAGLSAFALQYVGVPLPIWSLYVGGAETILAFVNVGLEHFILSEKQTLVQIQQKLELFQDYVRMKSDEFSRLSKRNSITIEELNALSTFNFAEVAYEIGSFEHKITTCLSDKCKE